MAKKTDNNEKAEIKNIVNISDAGPCKKKISVEVPQEAVKAALEQQYAEFKHDAAVPGFRKGRAPLRLLEKRFGKEVGEQVKLKLLATASEAAIKDNKIDSLGEPDIDYEKIELPDNGPLKFEFEVEVRPEFEMPAIEGIEVNKPKLEVTDEQLDLELKDLQKRGGIWAPQEGGKVELDDQLIADVELKIDGTNEVETSDNSEVFVRPNGFAGAVPVEKLDELLIGAKQGDVKTVTVEVSGAFHNEKYRGKKVDVKISIKDIKRLTPATLNDEFIKRFGVQSEQELREKIREHLVERNERTAQDAAREQIYKHLLSNTTFDLPADVVADQSSRLLQREYVNLMIRGIPREQIEEHMEQLRAGSEERAKEQLKIFFIMDKIAEKLEIEVTEEEINGHIARMAAQRNRRPEKMREEMLRDGSLAQFSMQIREEKCVSKLLETAKVSEVEASKLEETAKKAPKKAAKKDEPKEDATSENDDAPAKKSRKKKSE